MVDQIKKVKSNLQRLQQELEEETIHGKENYGLVTTVVNGKGEIIDFKFKEGIIDKEFKNALIDSINDGLHKAKKMQQEKKRKIAGDIPLPDLPDIF